MFVIFLTDFFQDSMKMWMWDAWADQQKRPGEIFLFGKVLGNKGVGKADYQSICVQIENVEKCLFLLPREHVSVKL